MKKTMLAILFVISMTGILMLSGCSEETAPFCEGFHEEGGECPCDEILYEHGNVRVVSFLGNVCNCCYKEPYLNKDGYYETRKVCIGFNKTETSWVKNC